MDKIRSIYIKHQEKILYLFFGGATTLVNWVVYTLLLFVIPMAACQAVAWFVAVLFAFYVNKIYVFKMTKTGSAGLFRELLLFFGARVFSGVIEIGGLPLLVYIGLDQTIFGIEGALAKALLSVIVIILNYFFSKFIIFKRS